MRRREPADKPMKRPEYSYDKKFENATTSLARFVWVWNFSGDA